MALKLYYDLGSQPSRAVFMFLKLNNIPFDEVFVSIGAGEHRQEEFRKINPFRRVPVIDDNGFVLTESVAILKYLAKKYKAPSHWYPENDTATTARIDEYMNWQHQNLRQNCAMLFQNLILIPRMKGMPIDWEKVKFYRKKVAEMVKLLDQYFLKNNLYLCGDEITLADLLGVCELVQLVPVREQMMYESNAKVKAWVDRVKSRLGSLFNQTHEGIFGMEAMFDPKVNSKM
ncbi:glutathione S-transferase theta-1-like [Crassostrea angulata]|uniref:glutathione S-transferase theta-1-like n=1 Tax=Magallana angulata TaxID=2784310 RepID=UPI0022B10041|nr:glutathione S-transferase theta-1-like [Crassostrea angulata]